MNTYYLLLERKKLKYPVLHWTYSSIMCFQRNCRCNGCIYQHLIESTKCRMKISVIELVAKMGKPTKANIEKYKAIEGETKRNGKN